MTNEGILLMVRLSCIKLVSEGRLRNMSCKTCVLLTVVVGSVSLLLLMSRDLPENHNKKVGGYGE